MNFDFVVAVVMAAALSALCIGWLRRHPATLDVLDRPGEHKTHLDPVPAIGGIGVALGTLGALIALRSPHLLALGSALTALLALGLLDDHRGLSARTRFVVQASVVLLMAVLGGVLLRDFGQLLWPGMLLALGPLGWPVTVFCAVGVLNAMNMIDGTDGMCGSLALLSLLSMAWLAYLAGHGDAILLLACAAAIAAFLAFNLRLGGRPARVFLGNGGSMVIGGMFAWFLISLTQGEQRVFAPVTALWLLAVPLIDTVSVMWRRLAARRSPFAADHQHVHHLLLRAGWSVNGTLATLLAVQGVFCAAGIAGEVLAIAEAWRFAGFLLFAFALHAIKVWAARRLPPLTNGALH